MELGLIQLISYADCMHVIALNLMIDIVGSRGSVFAWLRVYASRSMHGN